MTIKSLSFVKENDNPPNVESGHKAMKALEIIAQMAVTLNRLVSGEGTKESQKCLPGTSHWH